MGYLTTDSIIVLGAVGLDLLLGDPRALPHPVSGLGRLISALEKLFRKVIPNEKVGGVALLVATVATAYACTSALLEAARAVSPFLHAAVALYLSWTCLAARSLHRESSKVIEALERGDLEGARHALSFIVGRETAQLDEAGVVRAAVETVAENTGDGVIAPLFFLLVGGPALAFAYKAVNTLDSMVGYKNDRYRHFGWASARFDDVANYLPARLTALLMVLAAPLCALNWGEAWRVLQRDCRSHASPNSGFPEAAAAGALEVQLGGPNRYFGKIVEKPTIGDATQPITIASYRGAVQLMYCSEALLVAGWLVFKLLAW